MQVFTQVLAASLVLAAAAVSAQERTGSENNEGAPHVLMQARPVPSKHGELSPDDAKASAGRAADAMAGLALAKAKVTAEKPGEQPPLSTAGKPGDVRLVTVKTDVIQRSRWIVPKVPIPPFRQWNQWLDEHPSVSHCALDFMDDEGKWWHTELRGYYQYPEEYRVGEGEFRATGTTIYGIFVVPGRSDPEDQEVLLDEKVNADWKKVVELARNYGRRDRRSGEPGTGGKGEKNVGLGGPAWRPTCNSNTFISYILKQCGVTRPEPPGAVGWDRTPTFPYSSDADAYNR
ncbi:MAG: hypothetical protein KIS92_09235 [Planctomycetota bacterium]|nr:hypothetical protein [Planctomycetota bacterium]